MPTPSSKADLKRWVNSHWKLSGGQIRLTVSSYSHAGGLMNALLRGWEGAADWQKSWRKPSLLRKRGSTSQTSAYSHGGSQEHDIVTSIMIQALNHSHYIIHARVRLKRPFRNYCDLCCEMVPTSVHTGLDSSEQDETMECGLWHCTVVLNMGLIDQHRF